MCHLETLRWSGPSSGLFGESPRLSSSVRAAWELRRSFPKYCCCSRFSSRSCNRNNFNFFSAVLNKAGSHIHLRLVFKSNFLQSRCSSTISVCLLRHIVMCVSCVSFRRVSELWPVTPDIQRLVVLSGVGLVFFSGPRTAPGSNFPQRLSPPPFIQPAAPVLRFETAAKGCARPSHRTAALLCEKPEQVRHVLAVPFCLLICALFFLVNF